MNSPHVMWVRGNVSGGDQENMEQISEKQMRIGVLGLRNVIGHVKRGNGYVIYDKLCINKVNCEIGQIYCKVQAGKTTEKTQKKPYYEDSTTIEFGEEFLL